VDKTLLQDMSFLLFSSAKPFSLFTCAVRLLDLVVLVFARAATFCSLAKREVLNALLTLISNGGALSAFFKFPLSDFNPTSASYWLIGAWLNNKQGAHVGNTLSSAAMGSLP
jgi:hypothetical protein